MSGAVYAASFKRGYLPIAAIPATLFGGFFLAIAIIRGEIAMGLEYTTSLSPWQFAIPVVVGIASSCIGAKIIRLVINAQMARCPVLITESLLHEISPKV